MITIINYNYNICEVPYTDVPQLDWQEYINLSEIFKSQHPVRETKCYSPCHTWNLNLEVRSCWNIVTIAYNQVQWGKKYLNNTFHKLDGAI